MNCIFCKIASKQIDSNILFEDDTLVAFEDINPQAPIHILIIPKEHIPTINDVKEHHKDLLGKMILTAKKLASEKQISESGYRLVFNTEKDSGQEVFHIHLHLLGGRKFNWPPG